MICEICTQNPGQPLCEGCTNMFIRRSLRDCLKILTYRNVRFSFYLCLISRLFFSHVYYQGRWVVGISCGFVKRFNRTVDKIDRDGVFSSPFFKLFSLSIVCLVAIVSWEGVYSMKSLYSSVFILMIALMGTFRILYNCFSLLLYTSYVCLYYYFIHVPYRIMRVLFMLVLLVIVIYVELLVILNVVDWFWDEGGANNTNNSHEKGTKLAVIASHRDDVKMDRVENCLHYLDQYFTSIDYNIRTGEVLDSLLIVSVMTPRANIEHIEHIYSAYSNYTNLTSFAVVQYIDEELGFEKYLDWSRSIGDGIRDEGRNLLIKVHVQRIKFNASGCDLNADSAFDLLNSLL